MILPIEQKLKFGAQLKIAKLQDNCMEAVYTSNPLAVLHGGTGIWRCYGGNRFSDDIDLYLKTHSEIVEMRNSLVFALNRYGAVITKASVIKNSTIFTIRDASTEIKLEVGKNKRKIKAIQKNYEKTDGTHMSILTLSPENFMLEKMETYINRGYIRDLYDIYHLSSMVNVNAKLDKIVCRFLDGVKKPSGEVDLKSIVYSGAVPNFEGMVKALRGHFCEVHR